MKARAAVSASSSYLFNGFLQNLRSKAQLTAPSLQVSISARSLASLCEAIRLMSHATVPPSAVKFTADQNNEMRSNLELLNFLLEEQSFQRRCSFWIRMNTSIWTTYMAFFPDLLTNHEPYCIKDPDGGSECDVNRTNWTGASRLQPGQISISDQGTPPPVAIEFATDFEKALADSRLLETPTLFLRTTNFPRSCCS